MLQSDCNLTSWYVIQIKLQIGSDNLVTKHNEEQDTWSINIHWVYMVIAYITNQFQNTIPSAPCSQGDLYTHKENI